MLRSRPKAAAGFTLIEMIVAMTIFGILVALVIPSMRTWMMNAKVRATADSLQNGLRMAQAESLRRSRQMVFALTNSTTPQTGAFTATASGKYWAIMVVPAMTDGSEAAATDFVESGVVNATSAANEVITSSPGGVNAVCFNSVGRLVAITTPGVAGATCFVPTAALPGAPAGAAPKLAFDITLTGADHPLRVQVALGGQVHMCDPSQTWSTTSPAGC